MLTYDFRLPPGPRTVEYALLAEDLGFRAVWSPEVPAFGHDVWVTLARIAEKTKRIKFGPSVLIPSYRHPMAQASAIATLEQIAPGLLVPVIGNTYAGAAMIGLTATLDIAQPGDRILVVSFGSGAGSDAFDITVTDKAPTRSGLAVKTQEYIARRTEIDYATYVRYRGKLAMK